MSIICKLFGHLWEEVWEDADHSGRRGYDECSRCGKGRAWQINVLHKISPSPTNKAIPDLQPDDVEWVVNDSAELGVKIGDKLFFLYKGHSIDYHELDPRYNVELEPFLYRPVGKREFGESCYPPHLEKIPEHYSEGTGWIVKEVPE